MRPRWLPIILIIAMTSLQAQNTVFEAHKQKYLSTNGAGLFYFSEKVWAWLENIKNGNLNGATTYEYDLDGVYKPINNIIHNIIRQWGTIWIWDGSHYPQYVHAWLWADWQAQPALLWILKQYGSVISAEDRSFIENLYYGYVQTKNFCPDSPNNSLADMVGRYIYLQDHKDLEVIYSQVGQNVEQFTYQGRTYLLGQKYNAYQLGRDWIFYKMEKWLKWGNGELDSPDYTHAQIHGFFSLYQFAQDDEMKRRSKMMLDFILLESVLDFTGNQWGGSIGRTYEGYIGYGKSKDYFYAFWDVLPPSHEPSYNIFVCDYRIPDLIWDIGDLSDEPDNYYHLNMEFNPSIVQTENTGKWNYVTKFYSLGGQTNSSWQLIIKSSDDPGSTRRPGVPFRLWINTLPEGADTSSPIEYQTFQAIGQRGFQYKNTIFCTGSYFHYAIDKNSFDLDQTVGNYRFIKEGRTMVAYRVRTDLGSGGMEVAIEGVDFPSFDAFKAAVSSRCDLDRVKFVNTRGDWVSYIQTPDVRFLPIVKKGGIGDYQQVFNFPFQRLQCVDNFGRYIVQWNDKVMTVKRHGIKIVYDFNTWTYTESTYEEDSIPPAAPVITDVKPK
ncbi:hypothetical protein JW948_02085 [bacterium]|nr:hypothetical protein [bacterium]